MENPNHAVSGNVNASCGMRCNQRVKNEERQQKRMITVLMGDATNGRLEFR